MTFTVGSEIGQLRQAIVHRPGLELSRLTPDNIKSLLFDDVVWASKAKEEHDAFAEALRDKGVVVHYYGRLLSETLDIPAGRAFVLDRLCIPQILGPSLVDPVRRLFEDQDADTLAELLIGGILKADLHPVRAHSLKWNMLKADDFILPPLPNHLFQRDNSCWIYGGVTINPMAMPARQRESLHTRAIYQFHPLFADAEFFTYYGGEDITYQPATIEGGDVHVIGHGAVLIGMGERTTPMAIEAVAHALFDNGQATKVVAIELPHSHAFMHLDTVMSMVDVGTFILYPYFDRHLRSWTIAPGDDPGDLSIIAQPQPVGHPGCDPRGPRDHHLGHRRGRPRRGARAVGRRHQLPGRSSRCGHGLSAERGHQHHAAQARHRSRRHRRQRTRPRSGRASLHDLPDRAGPSMTSTAVTPAPATHRLRGRSLLKEIDLTKEEFISLIDLAEALRVEKRTGTERQRMVGRNIALIFEKASTRTRCAFEVGAYDQGAHVTYLGPEGSHIGVGETIKDTARVLGRMFDGIEYRGFSQDSVETLAAFSGVPVWNGLTDQWHPTQMLADILTMRDHTDKPLEQVSYCYLGDARNNTANSLLVTGALLGMDVRIAAPDDLWPSARGSGDRFEAGCRVRCTHQHHRPRRRRRPRQPTSSTPTSGCPWASPTPEWKARIEQLRPYQVNAATMKATGNPDVKFMHCLPALHNTDTDLGRKISALYHLDALEVTEDVFESPACIVFDEAENRLHTIKAAMVASLGD